MRTSPVSALVFAVFTALLVGAAQASVKISAGHTAHMSCADGVCAPTAKNAILNATDLAEMLAASDITVATGGGAVTISIEAPFSWTSTHRLTLDANTNVIFKAPVEVAGTGAVTILVNDGGTDGALSFVGTGMLDFWDAKSSLVLNGQAFKLVPDLKTLGAAVALHPSRNFALMKSFDASVDGTYAAPPVAAAFDGKFDGLGHAIANLTVATERRSTSNLALFDSAGAHAVLRNVILQNFQMNSEAHFQPIVGMLASENSGEVNRISVIGGRIDLHAGYAGGIVGKNHGRISNSHVDGTDVWSDESGGIAFTNDGLIAHCQVNGAAVAGGYAGAAGGIAVDNNGTIRLSYTTGGVGVPGQGSGDWGAHGNEQVGGIAAFNFGSIDRSFSVAEVNGGSSSEDGGGFDYWSYAGGLVGENYGAMTNSYARGTVESADPFGGGVFLGGAIGYSRAGSSVAGTYSTGTFSCPDCTRYIGGFAAAVVGAAADYWDMDTSGRSNGCGKDDCSGIAGLTTAQFKSGLPAGFDPAIWAQDPAKNEGYPYLIDNPPPD